MIYYANSQRLLRCIVKKVRKALWVVLVLLAVQGTAVGKVVGESHRESHEVRGGRPIPPDMFLFNASIGFGDGWYCSASLIAPRWILTAAHCFTDYDDGFGAITLNHNAVVQVAEHSRSPGAELNERYSTQYIRRIILHPEYYSGRAGFKNDAALVELTIDSMHEPVSILSPEEEARFAPSGTTATVVTVGGDPGFVEMPLYLGRDCRDAFNIRDANEVAHDRTVCTGVPGDPRKGTQPGDSGGSVVVPIGTAQSGETLWGQVGVHSMSGRNNRDERIVSVATRVSSIYDWIKSYTEQPISDVEPILPYRKILTHVFAGPLANATAETEITVINRSHDPCSGTIRFHRGTEEAPPVRFNGEYQEGNRANFDLPGHGRKQYVLTVDAGNDLTVGAIYADQTRCPVDSLHLEGRYLVTSNEGQIMEAFSILPQSERDWLRDGECRWLSSRFGSQDNVGLAMVTANPGQGRAGGNETCLYLV